MSFNPAIGDIQGQVKVIVRQSDGKFIVGGNFQIIGGGRRERLARLNQDGSIDNSFNANLGFDVGFYNYVNTICIQPDNKILVGGNFQSVNGIKRKYIVRLNADGTIDNSFNIGTGANSTVYDIEILSDGKILVAGQFSSFNGFTRTALVRLNPNGTLDEDFAQYFGDFLIEDVDVQPNGSIYVSGTTIGSNGQRSNGVARLNSDGALDPSFNTGSGPLGGSFGVIEIEVLPNGKVLIGGDYDGFNSTNYAYLTLLNSNGSVDTSFNIVPFQSQNTVESISVQPDGKIIIGGAFATYGSIVREGIMRLNANGTIDTSFDLGSRSGRAVYACIILPDGRVVIGGHFTKLYDTYRYSIACLNSDNTLSSDFSRGASFVSGHLDIFPQNDGKIVIGGYIRNVNGKNLKGVERLNQDGTSDLSFNPNGGVEGLVNTVATQNDGKILVGGDYNSVNGVPKKFIARLNIDGSLDTSFNPLPDMFGETYSIAVQNDGKVLIGGHFYNANTTDIRHLIRLNPDGTEDATFISEQVRAFDTVKKIVVQSDGKITIGGQFSFSTTFIYHRVIRLNPDGTIDSTFDMGKGANNRINTLVLQSDGKILVAGEFDVYNNLPCKGLIRLNQQGSVDFSFNVGTGSNTTGNSSLAIQPDGKILVGGYFNSFNGFSRPKIVRLFPNGAVDTEFAQNLSLTDELGVYTYWRPTIAVESDGNILVAGPFSKVNNYLSGGLIQFINQSSLRRTQFDFDGDSKADISIFRPNNGEWWFESSLNNAINTYLFGLSADKIVPGDYDGDGKTDFAVWRPDEGNWYILQSSNNNVRVQHFGISSDKPVAADYDGDTKTDIAVYRPSEGNWYVWQSSNNNLRVQTFGLSDDQPVSGDYDGDGKTDFVVYRPNEGNWYLLQSQAGFRAYQFGVSTDKPVVGDFDGDQKTDVAVYRPENGTWYILESTTNNPRIQQFGISTDIPVSGDYDGDGKTDVAVYRSGTWYILKSSNQTVRTNQFGLNNDMPVPSAYIP